MNTIRIRNLDGGTLEWNEDRIRRIRDGFHGELIVPGENGYEEARKVWNGMIDRRPALIMRCASEIDVITAVDLVRENRLLSSIRGGGHQVGGQAAADGGVMIDLSRMKGIEVVPVRRIARVQPGVVWGELDRATQIHGLATPGGEVSITGVAGLTLSGGMGFARRAYGLSCDNLEALELVTAEGAVVRASASERPDLFWALRGGGGNFGVVTAFEFRLHDLGPEVYALGIAYRWEDARAVMKAWRDYAESAPKEVTLNVELMSVPAHPFFPEELHGVRIVNFEGMYAGDPGTGERLLEPLRRLADPVWDESGVTTYVELQSAFDPFAPEGDRYYWKSHFLDGIGDETLERMLAWAENRPSPRTLLVIRQLGGAIADVDETATAYGNRSAPYNLSIDAIWERSEDDEENVAWTRACWSDLGRYANGGVYLNFAGDTEEGKALARAGVQENYARLLAIKRVYDPENLFRMNANIDPRQSAASDDSAAVPRTA